MKFERKAILLFLLTLMYAGLVPAQNSSPLERASAVEVYKRVDSTDLKAYIFNPPKHESGSNRAAIVFFFGGGWRGGTPAQFVPQCEYLASRGMVAITVDYRVFNRQGVLANKCVQDAKSAIRWMRENASRLGIDPQKIVAAGGSAGGHLAASTATLPEHNDSQDDLSISAIPSATALFNPAVILASVPGKYEIPAQRMQALEKRLGAPPQSMSPYHHIQGNIGPSIIFHGTADKTVDFRSVQWFQEKMEEQGNSCVLVGYEGEGHGFFNFGRKNNGPFQSTMEHLDKFLVGLGYLSATPTSFFHDIDKQIFLAQGAMVGEISSSTAILQTRLSAVWGLSDGRVPGAAGKVRFGYGLSPLPDPDWVYTVELEAVAENDFIVKTELSKLKPGVQYYYQIHYGKTSSQEKKSPIGSFRTTPGSASSDSVSFVVVTGMNYYHFHYGNYDSTRQYMGEDKALGYPALATILNQHPDYFIGTGDNVYFDHPAERGIQRAKERGKNPLPGLFAGKAVTDEAGMRRKYQVQFVQPRFVELFRRVGTYWMKDDHDYRINDSDPYTDFPISHELGVKNFREQLPVVFPPQSGKPTYRSHQLSKDVQIWLLEGRDYRSANSDAIGPEKTLWGAEQKAWLKQSLLASTATFKFIISPTPMVGPDDAYKKDNHVNPQGFKHEGEDFFAWLAAEGFLEKHLYFICGDRHWQYHAVHPSGFEEFSCGALVDANSRAGRLAGDSKSTDPEALIKQVYVQGKADEASGGFLKVSVKRKNLHSPMLIFSYFDEKGKLLYSHKKETRD